VLGVALALGVWLVLLVVLVAQPDTNKDATISKRTVIATTGFNYICLCKWLALICFGPITFVAVGIMSQIDVFCALFIFLSLILVRRALCSEQYFSFLLLGYLVLGISMELKTYGGLLLPVMQYIRLRFSRIERQA
jgi:hypothetical protein